MLKSGSRVLNYALKKCKNESGGADLPDKEIHANEGIGPWESVPRR